MQSSFLDRRAFVALGARGGAALAVGGLVLEAAPASAARAVSGPFSDVDLALARLAVGAEILAVGFYTRAIASRKLAGDDRRYLRRALHNEREHLAAVSDVLAGAGQTAATADDFTVTFPKGAFASRAAIARLGTTLETAFVGTYLGAVDAFGPSELKTIAARIAASEAQHLSVLAELASDQPVGISFPVAIDYEHASDVLDAYLS